jgi:hypothetical protein
MEHRDTLNSAFKHNPFVVPENYFETFTVRKSIAFNNRLKESAFAVPEGYFETLQERITESRLANAGQQPAVLRWQPVRAQLAFAASFALLIAVGYGVVSLLWRPAAASDKSYAEFIPSYLSQVIDEPALIHAVVNEPKSETHEQKPVVVEMDDDTLIRYLANVDVSLHDIAAIY